MVTTGTVRVWHAEQGWGVIDSPDTPGGCWAHFSHLWAEEPVPPRQPSEIVETTSDFRELFDGETVDFEWESPGQDGYDFRAVTVRPHGRPPPRRSVRRYWS
jgi:CspA family cold shock protein